MENEEVNFFMDNLKETKGGCTFVLKVMDRELLNDTKCSETEPAQLSQCIDLDSQDDNNNNYDHINNIKIGEIGSFEITAKDDEYSSDDSIVFDSEIEVIDDEDSDTSDDESEGEFNEEDTTSKVRFNLIPKFHVLRVWKFAAKEARIDYHWKNLQHKKIRDCKIGDETL